MKFEIKNAINLKANLIGFGLVAPDGSQCIIPFTIDKAKYLAVNLLANAYFLKEKIIPYELSDDTVMAFGAELQELVEKHLQKK